MHSDRAEHQAEEHQSALQHLLELDVRVQLRDLVDKRHRADRVPESGDVHGDAERSGDPIDN